MLIIIKDKIISKAINPNISSTNKELDQKLLKEKYSQVAK